MAAFIMFYTDPINASVSLISVIALFFYIHFRAPPQAWGDVTQALIYHQVLSTFSELTLQVRKYLLRLDSRKQHVKYWHPNVLLLVNDPRDSIEFIYFLNTLKKGGLLILGTVLVGEWKTQVGIFNNALTAQVPLVPQVNSALLDFIESAKLKAFSDVVVAENIHKGFQSLILVTDNG